MKRTLLIALLLFCSETLFAQSITINDLANISNLSNAEAHNYLTLGKNSSAGISRMLTATALST
ncbi:hypothetical protein ACRQ5D_01150 [Mucilaginibacter sp. P25]|uniref:hypothetical protein n=1 Tax=Mucilaginibacter sp. P25 TaxID=3423945 RepID=UPI003D792FED